MFVLSCSSLSINDVTSSGELGSGKDRSFGGFRQDGHDLDPPAYVKMQQADGDVGILGYWPSHYAIHDGNLN
jgi:hypothetical protein